MRRAYQVLKVLLISVESIKLCVLLAKKEHKREL
jgi:hypothetical protein